MLIGHLCISFAEMFIQAFCSSFNHIFGLPPPFHLTIHLKEDRCSAFRIGSLWEGRPDATCRRAAGEMFWGRPGSVQSSQPLVLSHLSCVRLFATPWTVTHQAPRPWILRAGAVERLPCPPSGDLPDAGVGPVSLTSPALLVGFFTTSAPGAAPSLPVTAPQSPTYQSFHTSALPARPPGH